MASPATNIERGSTELRDAILEAATRLFADHGYAATSMRQVAAEVSCTKPALYYYFESKSALFIEVIQSRTEAIKEILETTFSEEGTVRDRLERAAEIYLDQVRKNPIGLKVLLRSEMNMDSGQPDFDWKSTRKMYLDRMRQLLEEGVGLGEIAPTVNLEDAVFALIGIIDVRCTLWVLQGEPIPEDCAGRALALLFGGLSP